MTDEFVRSLQLPLSILAKRLEADPPIIKINGPGRVTIDVSSIGRALGPNNELWRLISEWSMLIDPTILVMVKTQPTNTASTSVMVRTESAPKVTSKVESSSQNLETLRNYVSETKFPGTFSRSEKFSETKFPGTFSRSEKFSERNLLTELPSELLELILNGLPYNKIVYLEEQFKIKVPWRSLLKMMLARTGNTIEELIGYVKREAWSDKSLFEYVDRVQNSPYATIHTVYANWEAWQREQEVSGSNDVILKDQFETAEEYLRYQMKKIPKALLRSGDMIENMAESGYLSDGVSMIDFEDGEVAIVPLNYELDDYGSPAKRFTYPTYSIDYWDYDKMRVIGDQPNSYWHAGGYDVAIDPSIVVRTVYIEIVCVMDPAFIEANYSRIDPLNNNEGMPIYSTFTANGQPHLVLRNSGWNRIESEGVGLEFRKQFELPERLKYVSRDFQIDMSDPNIKRIISEVLPEEGGVLLASF
jgi:hypothetical protein